MLCLSDGRLVGGCWRAAAKVSFHIIPEGPRLLQHLCPRAFLYNITTQLLSDSFRMHQLFFKWLEAVFLRNTAQGRFQWASWIMDTVQWPLGEKVRNTLSIWGMHQNNKLGLIKSQIHRCINAWPEQKVMPSIDSDNLITTYIFLRR